MLTCINDCEGACLGLAQKWPAWHNSQQSRCVRGVWLEGGFLVRWVLLPWPAEEWDPSVEGWILARVVLGGWQKLILWASVPL